MFLLSLAIMFSVLFCCIFVSSCCAYVFLLYICVFVYVNFDGTNQCSRKPLDICVYCCRCVVFSLCFVDSVSVLDLFRISLLLLLLFWIISYVGGLFYLLAGMGLWEVGGPYNEEKKEKRWDLKVICSLDILIKFPLMSQNILSILTFMARN